MVSKQDDQFQPEDVDEQIERLAHPGNSSPLPEARLLSDLRQTYEEQEIVEQVRARLNRHIALDSQERTEQKRLKEHTPYIVLKEAQAMKKRETPSSAAKNIRRGLELIAAVLVVVALVGSMAVLFHLRQARQTSVGSGGTSVPAIAAKHTKTPTPTTLPSTPTPTVLPPTPTVLPSPTATATPSPEPTSVKLQASGAGFSPVTGGNITIRSGTKVTLTVIPDHPLLPYPNSTMGIYAADPNAFSELQYCKYPDTATCTYVINYSGAEGTDYRKGTHTFVAFLGNTNGNILYNSVSITITWS